MPIEMASFTVWYVDVDARFELEARIPRVVARTPICNVWAQPNKVTINLSA